MIKTTSTLIPVKQTKSVEMYYETVLNGLWIYMVDGKNHVDIINLGRIFIPMSKVFQVIRGLTSCVARFYRKREK